MVSNGNKLSLFMDLLLVDLVPVNCSLGSLHFTGFDPVGSGNHFTSCCSPRWTTLWPELSTGFSFNPKYSPAPKDILLGPT